MDASKVGGEWRPIHDNHAIEVMAVAITFSQPLTDRVLTRVFKAGEDAAFKNGLRSRHLMHGLQVAVSPGVVPQLSNNGPVVGRIYNAIQQDDDGKPTDKVSEQLQIDTQSIVYRTWNYVSWAWQLERFDFLIKPALVPALDAVSVQKVRLEYLDRFMFTGDADVADPKEILKSASPLVAPHVYSVGNLWHSHSGAFISGPKGEKWLLQANLNAADQPSIGQSGGPIRRWLNIMTALEQHRVPPSEENELEQAGDIVTIVDALHEPLKNVLSDIISESMAQRIYLEA